VICDFHIHSKYSFDSIIEPRDTLRICRKKRYNNISITDHGSLKGSLEAKRYEREFGVNVLIGEEILTNSGDIIGLNLNEEVKSTNWVEVLEEIQDQGGISILPHPFRGHKDVVTIAKRVDLIEVWNSRNRPIQNEKALELARVLGKPPVAGSDVHVLSEIGNAVMEFEDLFDFEKRFYVKYCKKYEKVQSYIIKDIKFKKFHRILPHLFRLIY